MIVTVQDENTVRLRRETGGEEEGTITQNRLNKDSVDVLVRWLNRGQLETSQEFKVLGTHLYHLLFNGQVETFFENALNEAKKRGERLSLQLSFQHQAKDLSILPWEYLYYPDTEARRGFFLATHLNLAISRFLPLGSISSERGTGKLKILIVMSQPTMQALIPAEPVAAEPVVEALQKLMESSPIEIGILKTPTVDNFLEELANFKPHIVHFLGHGQVDEEGDGQIALLMPDEQSAAWCNFDTVAEYFSATKPLPRLVFLHMNERATPAFTFTLKELAGQLLRSEIQAVVAMQYPISNVIAIRFCRKFYSALAAGEFIDCAVQAGRYEMIRTDPERYTNRMFGGPVLYMRDRTNIVQPADARVPADRRERIGQSQPTRKLPYIMAAAQSKMNKMNVSVKQQKVIEDRMAMIRKCLENTSDSAEWSDILMEAWDAEPAGTLKEILFAMHEEAQKAL
jgi:hypothetical protein